MRGSRSKARKVHDSPREFLSPETFDGAYSRDAFSVWTLRENSRDLVVAQLDVEDEECRCEGDVGNFAEMFSDTLFARARARASPHISFI